ncbi:MAG: carbohydrate ABC transporter permease [Clostridiales bacterium]|nr:carbohydrate ABC transporter permease [Clostridiales bacterium]
MTTARTAQPRRKGRIKSSWSDRAFDSLSTLLLTAILLAIALPLMYVVSCSLSSGAAVAGGRVWIWPVDLSLEAYRAVFDYRAIWIGYYNTLCYTAAAMCFSVSMTLLAAYPLSRRDFGMRRAYMRIFTFTMLFSGGLIPYYITVQGLGLVNTFWAMVIPGGLSVWNVIITRTFFEQTLSGEILDAAQIDGCTDFGFFLRIALPLSGAIIAVNALFYAVGKWNAYFDALILLREADRMPLQIILRRILILNSVDKQMTATAGAVAEAELSRLRELIKYALIIVSSLPVLCLYPFVQKYFVRGLMIGSVKG